MTSQSYIWDTKEQQNSIKPYGFIDFSGDFLKNYFSKRNQAINFLKKRISKRFDLTKKLPTRLFCKPVYSQKELKKSNIFDVSKVIRTLYNSFSQTGDFNEIEQLHFERILKKIELKKLREVYNHNFINTTTKPLDLESYALFSITLGMHSQKKKPGYLQSLSTLLKLNDSLLSKKENVIGSLEKLILPLSLKTEREEVEKLMKNIEDIKDDAPKIFSHYKEKNNLVLKDLGMLMQEGNRAKAYLQKLIKTGLLPNFVLFLKPTIDAENLDTSPEKVVGNYFDPTLSEIDSLENAKIPYKLLLTNSCNSPEVIKEIEARKEQYFVYSGKDILNRPLDTGKKFIHIHPAKLPEYRGSTCHFYSVLAGDGWSCTGFMINKGIDTGKIILTKKFPLPEPKIDYARIYDPYLRSEVLGEIINQLAEKGSLLTTSQNASKGRDYFIIHPVLAYIRKVFLDNRDTYNDKIIR